MQADPKALIKINQTIKAVCHEWQVTPAEVISKSVRSTVLVTDARRAICYLVKHNNNVRVPRFILANILNVNEAQVSKYVIKMGRWMDTYDEMREKVDRAAKNIPFMVNQLKMGFDATQAA